MVQKHSRRTLGATAVALTLVMGMALIGCSSSSKTASSTTVDKTAGDKTAGNKTAGSTKAPKPELFDGTGDFYAAPDPIPDGPHGTLLRYQPVNPTFVDGAKTWKIMYLSRSVGDKPIVVTGDVLVPDSAAPAGGRRLITLAHGTTGVADQCAPSKGRST